MRSEGNAAWSFLVSCSRIAGIGRRDCSTLSPVTGGASTTGIAAAKTAEAATGSTRVETSEAAPVPSAAPPVAGVQYLAEQQTGPESTSSPSHPAPASAAAASQQHHQDENAEKDERP